MKNFAVFFILFVFNFVAPYTTWAKPVQVYDFGVVDLHSAMYRTHKLLKSPYDFNELIHVGKVEKNSPYDLYATTIGSKGNGGTFITFYSNLSGYVSKISVMPLGDNIYSNDATALALTEILSELGLKPEQIDAIHARLTSQGRSNSSLWISNINRRIILEYKTLEDQSLYYLITADDL